MPKDKPRAVTRFANVTPAAAGRPLRHIDVSSHLCGETSQRCAEHVCNMHRKYLRILWWGNKTSRLAAVHVAVSFPAFGYGQTTVPRAVRAQDCLTFPRSKPVNPGTCPLEQSRWSLSKCVVLNSCWSSRRAMSRLRQDRNTEPESIGECIIEHIVVCSVSSGPGRFDMSMTPNDCPPPAP
jgi:hypothetical protein